MTTDADVPSMTMTMFHGLFYVDRFRHNPSCYTLSEAFFPAMERPERDVCKALLRFALEQLDKQDAEEAGS